MADVVPFPPPKADGPPALYVAWCEKDRRTRLYRIDPIGGDWWRCEVWMQGGIHRSHEVQSLPSARRLLKQFEAEVAELQADGWTVTL